MSDWVLRALRYGFVLPREFQAVAGSAPVAGDPTGPDAPSGSVHSSSAGAGGAGGLGGTTGKPMDGGAAPTANGAAQPLWCSDCLDAPVWCEDSDICLPCVERRLWAWMGGER